MTGKLDFINIFNSSILRAAMTTKDFIVFKTRTLLRMFAVRVNGGKFKSLTYGHNNLELAQKSAYFNHAIATTTVNFWHDDS